MTTELTTTTDDIFEEGLGVAYYKPKGPAATDYYGVPYILGGRVITRTLGNEYATIKRTFHENPTIQSLYEEFKMEDNKLFWLSENRSRLEKHDINVDNLIEAHKNV